MWIGKSYFLNSNETRTIIVHRSEDVIFSARTKNVAAVSFYLPVYLSIYVSISIYLYIYIIHILWTDIYICPGSPCMPSQQVATLDMNPPPLAPMPNIYLSIYPSMYLYISFFPFIYLYIYICIWKLSIYLRTDS